MNGIYGTKTVTNDVVDEGFLNDEQASQASSIRYHPISIVDERDLEMNLALFQLPRRALTLGMRSFGGGERFIIKDGRFSVKALATL